MEKSGILERKAIIKNADMTEDMQQDAIECATAVWCIFPSFTFLTSSLLDITYKTYSKCMFALLFVLPRY